MFEGPSLGPDGSAVEQALGTSLVDALRRNGIRGRRGETFALEGLGMLGSKRVLLIGADRGDDVAAIRETAMRAGAVSRPHRTVATTVVPLGADASDGGGGVRRGVPAGELPVRPPSKRRGARPDGDREAAGRGRARGTGAKRGVERGTIVGAATNWARDLTNAPASESTPAMIADETVAMAERLGLSSKVWTQRALERGGFGGILGVGAGSANEPRLVELAYRGGGRGGGRGGAGTPGRSRSPARA